MNKTQMELISVFLIIFITFNQSHAKQTELIPDSASIDQNINTTHEWSSTDQIQSRDISFKFSAPMVAAGFLCFIASSISSAGGIGGGGLFIPIMKIVAGLDLNTASSFSAFMVTGGSVANVICHLFTTSSKFGGKTLIDYDLALLLEPCMLLGVSVGVICNRVFPEWLITILFAVFLVWSTFKTCSNGVFYWKMESEMVERNECEELRVGLLRDLNVSEETKRDDESLLCVEGGNNKTLKLPWMKLGVLVMVWFSFFAIYLLRGNKYGQGIISMEPCGVEYWTLSSLQIPLAIAFTAWILCSKKGLQYQSPKQDMEDPSTYKQSSTLMFPLMALLAGILGGLFGIGGGMLISPLLLQVGIAPEITAATCSFMVFFSSTMSAIQYLFLGMEHTEVAMIFAIVCFVASLLGLVVVQRAIDQFGRASLIVFSVSIVMALSTVLMTTFGALDVWKNYISGEYMGFNLPC